MAIYASIYSNPIQETATGYLYQFVCAISWGPQQRPQSVKTASTQMQKEGETTWQTIHTYTLPVGDYVEWTFMHTFAKTDKRQKFWVQMGIPGVIASNKTMVIVAAGMGPPSPYEETPPVVISPEYPAYTPPTPQPEPQPEPEPVVTPVVDGTKSFPARVFGNYPTLMTQLWRLRTAVFSEKMHRKLHPLI